MKQILTRLLIFAICCIMCIHTFSICTRSVIYILFAIILAFGTILIADRLPPTAPVLIHVGIFILCCLCLKFVVFLPVILFLPDHTDPFLCQKFVCLRCICKVFHTSFEYDMSNIVPKDIKYCLISIAKEAITNAVKHSNGDQLSILIREHPGFYQLTIRDNGTGIHLTDSPGIGLTNIRERVQSLSGTLQISMDSS